MAIAELEFKEDDAPALVEAKLRMLEVYNARLDEVRVCVGGGC